MAISAAAVIPMPRRLVSFGVRYESAAMPTTVPASRKSRIAAARSACAFFSGNRGRNCRRTTEAESSSIRLSDPNASRATLCAWAAAHSEPAHSSTIQTMVMTWSHATCPERRGRESLALGACSGAAHEPQQSALVSAWGEVLICASTIFRSRQRGSRFLQRHRDLTGVAAFCCYGDFAGGALADALELVAPLHQH